MRVWGQCVDRTWVWRPQGSLRCRPVFEGGAEETPVIPRNVRELGSVPGQQERGTGWGFQRNLTLDLVIQWSLVEAHFGGGYASPNPNPQKTGL